MYRILIADDSKPIRRVVELSLERDDIELKSAADGQTALEIVDAGFFPHLAVVDVHMPRMGGLELCRELRARTANIAALLLVGTFEPFDEQEGRDAGASGHLLKPFSADELRGVVDSMLPGDSRLVSKAETIASSDVGPEDGSADDRGASEENAAQEDTAQKDTAEGLASPSHEEQLADGDAANGEAVDEKAGDGEVHQGEEDGDEFLTPLGSSLTILPEESLDSTVVPSMLTGDLDGESDATAQDATDIDSTEIGDSDPIDQEKGVHQQGGAELDLKVDWDSAALEGTDAVVEPEEPELIEAEALSEESDEDTAILSDELDDSEEDDFEEFSVESDQESEPDEVSQDDSEQDTEEARQAEPATEINLGDGAPSISLSSEQLDVLAIRVAEHLGENLFRDRADELFVRVATEQVEARIDRLEQELAAQEDGDDANADDPDGDNSGSPDLGSANADRDLLETEGSLGESEPNDLEP